MNYFESLAQYHFERDVFCKIVYEIMPDLEDVISDKGYNFSTDNFILFRKEDEFYIIYLDSGLMINWYKHLGRSNTCNKNIKVEDLRRFLELLKEDLE